MQATDRTLFQRIVAIAALEARPLTEALGLSRSQLDRLAARHLPVLSVPSAPDDGPGPDALEEPDLREYLLECRAGRGEEEEWLAAIVARRSLLANHLWQDLGLADRSQLTTLFQRHFPELARRNRADMKWKKFFYRQLCQREGIPVCKAPNCQVCADAALCFGPETGEPLVALAALSRLERDCRIRNNTSVSG